MTHYLWNDDRLLEMSWKDQVINIAAEGTEERIIRALIKTQPEEEWSQLKGEHTPPVINQAIETIYWEKNALLHHHEIKEQPKYRSVEELLADFHGFGIVLRNSYCLGAGRIGFQGYSGAFLDGE